MSALTKRITALEAALEKANGWIISHKLGHQKDHACSQCMGEDTRVDFVCAYHAALAPASAPTETEKEQ